MKIIDSTTILISGGCSFVGNQLVTYLLNHTKSRLIVCYRTFSIKTIKDSRITYENADLLNADSYENIFKKYDPKIVFHLAAITRLSPGEKDPVLTVKTNYFGTKMIADLCIKYNVKSFISLSSNLARNPKSVIGLLKYLSEVYLRKTGNLRTKMISIRLPNVPDSPGSVILIFKKQIDDGSQLTVTDPLMERRFVSNEYASKLLKSTADIGKNGNVFIVAIENTKISDLAKEMIKKSGKHIDIKYIGIKPGEKLIEERYEENEIIKTKIKDLSILINDWSDENINDVVKILSSKSDNKSFQSLVEKIKVSLQR